MVSQPPTQAKRRTCKICGRRKREGEYICGICERARADRSAATYIAGLTCKVRYCPGGEYARGATFPGGDFGLSMKMSKKHSPNTLTIGHWVEGMVVEDANGHAWMVEGPAGAKQRLIPVPK
jgi:hypothetical protein